MSSYKCAGPVWKKNKTKERTDVKRLNPPTIIPASPQYPRLPNKAKAKCHTWADKEEVRKRRNRQKDESETGRGKRGERAWKMKIFFVCTSASRGD